MWSAKQFQIKKTKKKSPTEQTIWSKNDQNMFKPKRWNMSYQQVSNVCPFHLLSYLKQNKMNCEFSKMNF